MNFRPYLLSISPLFVNINNYEKILDNLLSDRPLGTCRVVRTVSKIIVARRMLK